MATVATALLASLALFQGADASRFSLFGPCDWPKGRGAIPLVAKSWTSTYSPIDISNDLGRVSSTSIPSAEVVTYDSYGKSSASQLSAIQFRFTKSPVSARYELQGPHHADRSIGVFLEIDGEQSLVDCFAAIEFDYIDVRQDYGRRCEAPIDKVTKDICAVAKAYRSAKLIGAKFALSTQTVAADASAKSSATTEPAKKAARTTATKVDHDEEIQSFGTPSNRSSSGSRSSQLVPSVSSAEDNSSVKKSSSSYVQIKAGPGDVLVRTENNGHVHVFTTASSTTFGYRSSIRT